MVHSSLWIVLGWIGGQIKIVVVECRLSNGAFRHKSAIISRNLHREVQGRAEGEMVSQCCLDCKSHYSLIGKLWSGQGS